MIEVTESEHFLAIFESNFDENTLSKIEEIGSCLEFTQVYDYELIAYRDIHIHGLHGEACTYQEFKEKIEQQDISGYEKVTLAVLIPNIR